MVGTLAQTNSIDTRVDLDGRPNNPSDYLTVPMVQSMNVFSNLLMIRVFFILA